ncbi:MAG: ATP-binding protein, partial [Verrucomicrobiae bacterium]
LSTLPERKFVDANVAFLSTLHLSKDEVVGKTALELGLFPDADAMRRTSEKLEAEGRLHNQELQVRRGDGTLMEGLFSAEVIVMRGRRHLLSVMIDVTALNRTTRLLEESERRLSLATKAGGVGIWDWDVVNNRLVWDDQMYRQYGITRDLFSGAYEAWTAGLHPDDRQRGDEEIQMALRGEKDFDTEFRVLWPDGSIHHIRAMALVQRNAGGEPLHMIGTNWDITKLKRAESTLLQNIARTEELARLKSRFVSMASHELRTPLANITLACELLKNFGKDMAADRSRAVFANLLNSVTFMTQTLDDLLLAGKLEEGKLSFNPGRLDLLLFLKRCCMEAQPSGEDPSRIEVAFRDAGMQVVADEQLLHHILKNLLENALKYSPPDSKVEVGAEVRRGVLTLSVSDRGIGVPEAERTFLFDAFSRASNVGDKPGSGLGLFIAQKCAQAHGGHMSYAPQPGGSVFSVTIPLPADPGSHQKT